MRDSTVAKEEGGPFLESEEEATCLTVDPGIFSSTVTSEGSPLSRAMLESRRQDLRSPLRGSKGKTSVECSLQLDSLLLSISLVCRW